MLLNANLARQARLGGAVLNDGEDGHVAGVH